MARTATTLSIHLRGRRRAAALLAPALLALGGCASRHDEPKTPTAAVAAVQDARATQRLELLLGRQQDRADALRALRRQQARADDAIAALTRLTSGETETAGSSNDRYGSALAGDSTPWVQAGPDATPAPNSNPETIARFNAAAASGRISLVGAAKAQEVADGLIDDRVLRLLLVLSQRHRLTVNSLRISHPEMVQDDLGSARQSNHIYGRAADVSGVDGVSCATETRGARYRGTLDNPPPAKLGPCLELAYEAAAVPGTDAPQEIIYYWRVPGPAGVSLKNHDDHVHLGYRSYEVSATSF